MGHPDVLIIPEAGRNVVGNSSLPAEGWGIPLLECFRFRRESRSAAELDHTATADGQLAQAELASYRTLRFPTFLKLCTSLWKRYPSSPL
jgi:hypothetical protein